MSDSLILPSRRGFLAGLVSALAAPAIVRAASLMPVKAMSIEDLLRMRMEDAYEITRQQIANNLYGELTDITRKAFVPRLFAQTYAPFSFREISSELVWKR